MRKEIDFEELKKEYYSGKPISEICSQFGICKQTLYNHLNSEECNLRRLKLHETDGCPLFANDYYNVIQCDDIGEWERQKLCFRDSKTKNEYKNNFCNCRNYENCKVYKIMLSFLE